MEAVQPIGSPAFKFRTEPKCALKPTDVSVGFLFVLDELSQRPLSERRAIHFPLVPRT